VLQSLVDAELVTVDGVEADQLGAYPDGPTSALLLGGAASEAGAEQLAVLAGAFAGARVPTVVAELFAEDAASPAERGEFLAVIRDDGTLAEAVATVDDAERTEGTIATVLALEDAGRGAIGHYGYGAGADRPLPEWDGQ
jgi:hypothetical protein